MTTRMKANSIFIPADVPLKLRTSLIKMYLRCPAQCLFRYFKGLIVLPKSYTTMGSCFHKQAEHHYKHKKTKGSNTKLSVLQDVFHEEFKKRKPMTQWEKEEKPEELEQEGVKLIVPAYYKGRATILEPKHIEESFEIDIPEANASLTGTMDLILTNDEIRDHKLRRRMPHWTEVFKSTQGKAYSIGYTKKFKKKPRGFKLDYILRRKQGTDIDSSKCMQYSEAEGDHFLKMLSGIVSSIRQGLFFPREENNYLCSPNFCGYWSICRKGQWQEPGVFTQVHGYNTEDRPEEEE